MSILIPYSLEVAVRKLQWGGLTGKKEVEKMAVDPVCKMEVDGKSRLLYLISYKTKVQ